MKYVFALLAALLIASAFGWAIGAFEGGMSHVLTITMVIVIYYVCRRILTGR